MVEEPSGAGRFVNAVLRPVITIKAGTDIAQAIRLRHDAHEHCLIVNSVNLSITCEPMITAARGRPGGITRIDMRFAQNTFHL